MTLPNVDESSSNTDENRIAELTIELNALDQERAGLIEKEKEYRAKEDPSKRITFAQEIFQTHQDQLRINVEMEFVQKKINRLRLGYHENAVPDVEPEGFAL